jgi:uncharacterized flavoprotein (TIGR03862 family)
MSDIAIIGAGPAGLIAAETLADAGHRVTVYERMPSVARKFLMAGRGGLNLTHSEDFERFVTRYGAAQGWLEPLIRRFAPDDMGHWANGLGAETFIGSSGRVFPDAMKASPLLRAWLTRLEALGVSFCLRHDWQGWNEAGALHFNTPTGPAQARPDATILALGGASWPRLGSDGSWKPAMSRSRRLRLRIAVFFATGRSICSRAMSASRSSASCSRSAGRRRSARW